MSAATARKHTDLPPLPNIADVYHAIKGEPLPGDDGQPERRGYCLFVEHNDVNNPSCDYNTDKGVFHCKTCEAQGSIFTLIIGAGKADSNKNVLKWLRDVGLMAERTKINAWDSVDIIYQYRNAEGAVMYEVGRWNNPKQFGQRVPDGKGGWKSGKGALDGIERVPYRFPELLMAAGRGEDIHVVEGEKDADLIASFGDNVTTNAQGANWKWPVDWADYFAGSKRVFVWCDNDEAGWKAGAHRASLIARVVPEVYLIKTLPGIAKHGDVYDFIKAGHSREEWLKFGEEHGELVQPYVPEYPEDAVKDLLDDLSDTGNGKWLVACIGEHTMRYLLNAQRWLGYDGRVWTTRINTVQQTEEAVMKMRLACRDYSGPNDDEFQDHTDKAASMGSRRNMLEASISRLGSYIEDFDKHRHYLNLANGTLNLHTGELQPHNREDYLTLISPVEFKPEADCPNFKKWLMAAVRDSQPLYDYMQMVMGSCLEGNIGLRRFYFIFGPKGTGKSTFIRMLERILGPYSCATDFKVLTESKFSTDGNGPSPALARLKGMRMVTASESRENDKLDVARIKQLIGGDTITARHLNAGFEEFHFEATLILSGNVMPRIIGDESIWDKFKPVPFLHQIGAEDPEFEPRELHPEMSGILNFALEGLRKLREAKYMITDPPEVIEARQAERDEQDPLKQFLMDCTAIYPDGKVEVNDMRTAYKDWCTRTGTYALGNRSLSNALKNNHKLTNKESHGKTWWLGVKLKRPEDINRVGAEGAGTDAF